ncbi:uncharacterized protein TRAVEDRAFT_69519 [Trametes versicolor FP-101664 SS1]|uniref:uncharacterized protein n=1 Tax=Trametes versicolor (strain FP-101664) TaxID=717944 RepID=UPI0004623592|nr:uncharacterized protein TRAVEDRAFT_69519 [Trametes versicolor FP-101664 SS1]EIW63573.1 hypothetical protein TRAVEDRAFT_69519 [Trametes versicolor FP-101664 SS1]
MATFHIPLFPFEKYIVAHAIFCVIGFLGFLPLGALLARYTRTYTSSWFTAHWICQLALAGPTIIIGVALGIHAVNLAESGPINDPHKKWGIAIFVLYLAQVAGGLTVHFLKPRLWALGRGRRPVQNYVHAVFGLLIIAFAMMQVRTGFRTEWPLQTGRGSIGNGANGFWYFWIIFLIVLYAAGLSLLVRQFRLEREARRAAALKDTPELKPMTNGNGETQQAA